MEHNGSASNADKIHQNRLSSVTEDEDQDAALTIVTVLDKVAAIVDSVQASQKRIEERHRAMENAMKTVQIDLLKFSQSHSNTGYVIITLIFYHTGALHFFVYRQISIKYHIHSA